jgi:subtilisin family serine protease
VRAGKAVAVLLLAASLTACTVVGAALVQPGPPPAPAMTGDDHLVLTIPTATADERARTVAELEARHGLRVVAQWPLAALDVQCIVVRVDPRRTDAVLAALAAEPSVSVVQRIQRFTVGSAPGGGALALTQTNLAAINAARAHGAATGAGVRVAVIDTAADLRHPDLADARHVVRDFVENGDRPAAETHGTAMAGIVAARGRLRGVAYDADLLALRGCWQGAAGGRGTCSSVSLARALNFAILNKADVINFSLVGPDDPLLSALIATAAAGGTLVVAAGGGAELGAFPASHPDVIVAAAPAAGFDPGRRATPAPASGVLSTAPGGTYDFFSGASVAAAHVSGVAALMRQVAPDLEPAAARAALRRAVAPGPDGRILVDACRAVDEAAGDGRCTTSAQRPAPGEPFATPEALRDG